MDAEDVVLGIVRAAGGRVDGRTYLQKVAYFVSKMLGVPLQFGPHYYGPYSPSITAEVDSQVAMGRLSETRESFNLSPNEEEPHDQIRYRYDLSDAGEEYLESIELFDQKGFRELDRIVKRIRETNANYRQLSYAAKLHYLLEKAGGRIARTTAKEKAKRLGWDILDGDFDTAVRILQKLDLAQSSE